MKLLNATDSKTKQTLSKITVKIKMSSSNQLISYAFSDVKLIPIQAEMAQSQISHNNSNMLFRLPPASIKVQSNKDEKQKSNNDTMDKVPQQ